MAVLPFSSADGADEEAASGGSGDESASAGAGSGSESGSGSSSKSASSGSSKSSSSTSVCDHDWVEITREEDVYETKELSICNVCGEDVTGNTAAHAKAHMLAHEGDGHHSEWVSVKVGTKTVGTGTYKCSKCGATK